MHFFTMGVNFFTMGVIFFTMGVILFTVGVIFVYYRRGYGAAWHNHGEPVSPPLGITLALRMELRRTTEGLRRATGPAGSSWADLARFLIWGQKAPEACEKQAKVEFATHNLRPESSRDL
jgi:hypothetical protein